MYVAHGRSLIASLLLAAGFAWSGAAEAKVEECNNCSISQMEEVAYLALDNAPVPYNEVIYFVDMQGGNVGKFELFKDYLNVEEACVPSPIEVTFGCVEFRWVDNLPVEQQVRDYIILIRQLGATPIFLPASADLPQNGYELVQYPQKQDAVSQYLTTTNAQQVQEAWNALSFLGISVPAPVTVTVRMPDGSTATYVWSPETKKFSLVKGSVRDSAGNRVPETPADVAGGVGTSLEYDFTSNPEDLWAFLDRMNMLGIPVTGPNTGRMVCSSQATGERVTVTCTSQ